MNNYTLIDGQWWYTSPSRGNRMRVYPQTCKHCGDEFISRHKQSSCTNRCRTNATRGLKRAKPLPPKRCPHCKKEFIPKRKTILCCSKRCAYNEGNAKRGLKGDKNPNWRGGVAPHGKSGYVRQYVEGRGTMLQHRVVMEQKLGRRLAKGENVHHINGIRDDNRPENLELWKKHQPPGQRSDEQRHCKTCTCHIEH